MRIRSALMVSLAAVGIVFVFADSASALQLGPVSVPVSIPPVTATVPKQVAVGPVVIPVAKVAPGLGVTVTVSPTAGVGVGVTPPTAIGPVVLPPVVTQPVGVTIGPGTGSSGAGATSTPPAATGGTPTAPVAVSTPGAPTPKQVATPDASPAVTKTPAAAVGGAANAAAARDARSRSAAAAAHVPAVSISGADGAVNASLRHASPQGTWAMLRDVTSSHTLWLLLFALIVVARLAAGGMLRDALRRSRSVSV